MLAHQVCRPIHSYNAYQLALSPEGLDMGCHHTGSTDEHAIIQFSHHTNRSFCAHAHGLTCCVLIDDRVAHYRQPCIRPFVQVALQCANF